MCLLGLEEYRAGASGRDAMNLALIAGGDKQIAFARERHGPDIFLVRIVEQLWLAVGRDLVNLAVGIGGGVERATRVEHQRVDLEAIQLGESAALAVAIDREDLGRSASRAAAGGVERPLGVGRQGPEIGRGGVEDLGELGRQENTAVRAQGEMGERSAFEIGSGRPAARNGCPPRSRRRRRQAPPGVVG